MYNSNLHVWNWNFDFFLPNTLLIVFLISIDGISILLVAQATVLGITSSQSTFSLLGNLAGFSFKYIQNLVTIIYYQDFNQSYLTELPVSTLIHWRVSLCPAGRVVERYYEFVLAQMVVANGGGVICTWWVETRDGTKHPVMCRTASYNKGLAPNVRSSEAEQLL